MSTARSTPDPELSDERGSAQGSAQEDPGRGRRAKPKKNRTYDATLDATRPPVDEATEAADADAADLFAEMKKREF